MKNKIAIIFSLTILVFLTSCSKNNDIDIFKIDTISMNEIPQINTLEDKNLDYLNTLEQLMENIPLDEATDFFKKEIADFLNTTDNAKLTSLTIEKDTLSVIKEKNKKSLDNLLFEIKISIDTKGIADSTEYAKDLSQQLFDKFWEYSYFAMKAKNLYITVYDLNDCKVYDRESTFTNISESSYKIQDEEEYYAQTLAFNYPNSILSLQKFGIIKSTDELYIEYYLNDYYFKSSNFDNQNLNSELDKLSMDIKQYLMSDEKFISYIDNLKILTISFYSGNIDDGYLTFNYYL